MTDPDLRAQLRALLGQFPATSSLVDIVLAEWPDHLRYIAKSMQARTPSQLAATEVAAVATSVLIEGAEKSFAGGYHITCDQLRDEEL